MAGTIWGMDRQDERVRVGRELALSRAWNAGWFGADSLRTVDGLPVTVVYRGRWTFGFGPDFRGALIAFGADLRQGDVEVHLRAGAWREHGHHLDPAYNQVVLHVVLEDGPRGQPCRRQDGVVVPTLVLGAALKGKLEELPPDLELPVLGSISDQQCIAEVSAANRAGALAALERAGDARLTAKAAGFEAGFTALPPGQVLYAGLLDALGYSRNREPMARLAGALPLADLEALLPTRDPAGALRLASALLLGVGGFLPAEPGYVGLLGLPVGELAAIERAWAGLAEGWRDRALVLGEWSLARTRPPNHPARRLLGLAGIVARCGGGGLLGACLEACAAEEAATGLAELRDLLLGPPRAADSFGRYIGEDRAWEMVANIVLPFALAYGAWSEDERLGAGAAALWEAAPATSGNEPIRALLGQIGGGKALRLKTSRQQQGALHLYRHFCEHRRCYECPIARLGRGDKA